MMIAETSALWVLIANVWWVLGTIALAGFLLGLAVGYWIGRRPRRLTTRSCTASPR